MNSTLSKIVIFAAGAAIGSAVTWIFVKKKYEQIAQEEIESVKEVFSKREHKDVESVDEKTEEVEEPDDLDEYDDIVRGSGYVSYSQRKVKEDEEKEDEDVEYFVEPYVISPDEFDENGYETVSLYYYQDGVLENTITGEVIDDEDIDMMIGRDSLNHFGEYEQDSVHVRNENTETDYEILRVNERYSEDD